VDGFETPPTLMMPHNPRYYVTVLERAGFTKAKDLLVYQGGSMEGYVPVPERLARGTELIRQRQGITLRPLDMKQFHADVDGIKQIYNAAWQKNWGFVPMTEPEIQHYAKELKPIMDENWAMVAETEEGEAVAVALTLPDYNQVLKKLNGRLLPFGWLTALRERKKIDKVRVFALGVKPEYQHTGVAAGLYRRHFDMAAATPQDGGEMGWILESNVAMNRGMEAMGGQIVKRYRVYGMDL
jgi:GNAT superfamily N-acetyltransferase